MKVAEMEDKYKRVVEKQKERTFRCRHCGKICRESSYNKAKLCAACRETSKVPDELGKWE